MYQHDRVVFDPAHREFYANWPDHCRHPLFPCHFVAGQEDLQRFSTNFFRSTVHLTSATSSSGNVSGISSGTFTLTDQVAPTCVNNCRYHHCHNRYQIQRRYDNATTCLQIFLRTPISSLAQHLAQKPIWVVHITRICWKAV